MYFGRDRLKGSHCGGVLKVIAWRHVLNGDDPETPSVCKLVGVAGFFLSE
jgi:hypothetical protein